jgi:hypothetical protein
MSNDFEDLAASAFMAYTRIDSLKQTGSKMLAVVSKYLPV